MDVLQIEAHPRPRQVADGEEPARVLPQRADEGRSRRNWARRRRAERDRGAGAQDQTPACRRPSKGPTELNKLEADVADVGGSHGGAQLHRLARRRRGRSAARCAATLPARRTGAGWTIRPGEGQGTHRRIPRRAAAREEDEGPILCPSGPPGVGKTSLGQSIAGRPTASSCACRSAAWRDEAEIRGHRRTYIGSMPGQNHPEHGNRSEAATPVRARRNRQDVDGLPRRSVVGAAGRCSIRAEQRSTTTILEVDFDPSEVMFVAPRTCSTSRRRCSTAWRLSASRLHRGGEDRHRQRYLLPEADQGQRPARPTRSRWRRGDARHHPATTRASRRAQPGT